MTDLNEMDNENTFFATLRGDSSDAMQLYAHDLLHALTAIDGDEHRLGRYDIDIAGFEGLPTAHLRLAADDWERFEMCLNVLNHLMAAMKPVFPTVECFPLHDCAIRFFDEHSSYEAVFGDD